MQGQWHTSTVGPLALFCALASLIISLVFFEYKSAGRIFERFGTTFGNKILANKLVIFSEQLLWVTHHEQIGTA